MPAKDLHQGEYGGFDSPASQAVAIAPDDANDLAVVTRAIYVGGAGDVSVVLAGDGDTVTFKAVPLGTFLPIAASRVRATGTTATLMIALW